ncbi:outer membrane protein A precursor [Vibrio maritimus]|uniref:Outer membrane protein A n=1 Tax=Vibrio maritimus TaxID=990268 RepID=A0A090TE38_9VIBR|nr:outer membrane protein A precursor [Vibrio maritimus]
MLSKKTTLATLFIASAGLSMTAFAEQDNTTEQKAMSEHQTPWYVGGKLGGTNVTDMDSAVTDVTSIDKSGTTWSIYGGYKVLPWLSLELGYTDLGKVELKDVSGEYKATGVDAGVKATYVINDKFDVFARAGAYFYDWKASGDGVCCDDKDTAATVGLGGEYKFASDWGALLEYKYYNKVGGSPSFHTYGVGVNYYF